MREFALCILPSSWCEAGVRNIGFITQVCPRFVWRVPSKLLRQLDLKLWCSTELFPGWSFFDEKMHGKSLMFNRIPIRGFIKNSLNFNEFIIFLYYISYDYIIILLYYYIIILLYYYIIILLYYYIIILLYYCIIRLLYYYIIILLYYYIIRLLDYYIIILLDYYIIILLYYCIIILLYL